MLMRKIYVILLGAFLLSGTAFAQTAANSNTNEEKSDPEENIVNHKVMMGETIALISKKYKVTPHDIYMLNPDATQGISYNMDIKIPMHKSLTVTKGKKEKPKKGKLPSRRF